MSKYRHQDISAVPAGWRVRTVKAGAHRVRVAFPPGARQKGSGKVVSVLHPQNENPCRMNNPAELVLMGANPLPGKRATRERAERIRAARLNPTTISPVDDADARRAIIAYGQMNHRHTSDEKAEELKREILSIANRRGWTLKQIALWAKQHGGALEGHRRLNPMFNANFSEDEKLTLGRLGIKWTQIQTAADVRKARKALREAAKIRKRFGNPTMPMAQQREQAAEIYSGFHAEAPQNKLVLEEPHIPAGAYPELGLLYQIYFKPTNPDAVEKFEKVYTSDKEDIHVIGTLDREQIYFAGGDQELDHKTLEFFGWKGEDRFRLGTARKIVYLARKYHEAVPKEGRGKLVEWIHTFGEETGAQPELWYDHGNSRLYLKRGEYEIKDEGIVN